MNIHPDIAAMIDVIAELNETTDSMTVEEAVHVRESVVELRRAANVLLGLCDTQLLAVLESPREFDGMRYSVGNDGKSAAGRGGAFHRLPGNLQEQPLLRIQRREVAPKPDEDRQRREAALVGRRERRGPTGRRGGGAGHCDDAIVLRRELHVPEDGGARRPRARQA